MVLVKYRRGVVRVDVPVGATVDTLKAAAAAADGIRLGVHRQAYKLVDASKPVSEWVRLNNGAKPLSAYGVAAGSTLELKDLGPQFNYRGVFVIEYLGPILIMLAYAARPALLYGKHAASQPFGTVQALGIALWIAHFVKRELETVFVHKFSHATMPLFNLIKNSVYYWGFALAVGYPLCHPQYTAPQSWTQVQVGAAIMVVAELVNFAVHLQLAGMRTTDGGEGRRPPTGPLFALVSCPNYTAEVLSWVGFSIMTQIALSYVFTVVGFAQMLPWALGKHRRYLESDPGYKKLGRTSIVPFVI